MNIIKALLSIVASSFFFFLMPTSLEASPLRIYIAQILGEKKTFVFQFALKINEHAEYLEGPNAKEKQFNAFCHARESVRFCGKVLRISDTQLLIEYYPYPKQDVSDSFSGDMQNNKAVFLVFSELEPFKGDISPSEFFRLQKSKELIAIIATPVQVGFLTVPEK